MLFASFIYGMACSKPDRLSLEDDSNRYITNFDLCLICQEATGEDLVENPRFVKRCPYQSVLDSINDRAKYGELKYIDKRKLQEKHMVTDVKRQNSTCHRSCYGETTHTGMVKPPTLVWRNHPHWYGETTHTGMEKPPTLVWRNHPHWYGKTCKKNVAMKGC